jgi:hypothetical protein
MEMKPRSTMPELTYLGDVGGAGGDAGGATSFDARRREDLGDAARATVLLRPA